MDRNKDDNKEKATATDELPLEGTAVGGQELPATEPEGEVMEEEVPKHRFAAIIEKEYPDRKFEKGEDYDEAVEELLNTLIEFKVKSSEANKILSEIFDANPELGLVVKDMRDGATFREAMARHIDPSELTPIEGDPDYEGWSKNKSERIAALEERKKREDDFNANLELSAAAIKEFAAENNMTDEQASTFLAPFDDMLAEINSGKITKETLIKFKRIMDYEKDVEAARKEGLMAGRNENITAKREKAPKGDGLPHLTGGAEVRQGGNRHFIDDIVDNANRNKIL
ncbi:MAG TPA: hypothetical protein GXZ49_10190 [Bacteroidetes bacterium]|jgi:hypothetical protein|nr:hypothetical protein [Bacteroidota bacterium]